MTNKILRGFAVIFLVATLLFALTACANNRSAKAPASNLTTTETGPIKIGAIMPLTGDGADLGNPMQKVAQIALEKVNADGGINGRPMELIWQDGKCNGEDAANAARKLIEVDNVKVIYGGLCSAVTLAFAPIAEKAGVVVLSPGASSPEITNAGNYIFRNYPSYATQGIVLAEEANRRGYKKVATLTEQTDYTLGIEKVFRENFDGEVDSRTFQTRDDDFKAALQNLKEGNPDALFINPQTPAKADLAFSQLEEMGWNTQLIGNDVIAGYQDLINKYAKTVEGMLVAEFSFDRTNPDFIALEEKYKEKTGTDLPYGTYASASYDAIIILKEAISNVGYDADKIRDYLYTIENRPGLSGNLTMDKNGDPMGGHRLEIVKEGKVVTLEST